MKVDYYTELADRFFSKVKISSINGCWLWMGAVDPQGYGRILYMNENCKAPSIMFLLATGNRPSGGHKTCVLHKCNNPRCVNIGHLYIGDHSHNANDDYRFRSFLRKRNL